MSNGPKARCVAATYENWEEVPVKRCDYTMGDGRSSTVFVLNADPDKLARWVVSACLVVMGTAAPNCDDALVAEIRNDSGAQFPVAGVVLESKTNCCQKCCFRDGVTISVTGWKEISRQWSSATKEDVELCLKGDVMGVGTFARIQSTTPNEYKKNGGKQDVGSDSHRKRDWLRVIRQSYQKAWTSDYNELMVAKARSLMSEKATSTSQ